MTEVFTDFVRGPTYPPWLVRRLVLAQGQVNPAFLCFSSAAGARGTGDEMSVRIAAEA